MIISSVKDLVTYKGLSKNLDMGIDYLQTVDTSNMEVGRIDIDGDNVYALVSEYNTRGLDEGKYETHIKYLDIQCLISGEEIILISESNKLTSVGYSEDVDKENYTDGQEDVSVKLRAGMALVLYPTDAHKVSCMVDNQSLPVKKLLLKVKI